MKSNAMLTAMGLHFARTGVGARYNAVMDTAMAHKLVELNNDFYRENGESFSQTRHAAWQGWHRALAEVEAPDAVLDIACGNARLKQFLEEHFSDTPFAYHGIDACPSMLPPDSGIAFQQLDLLSLLVNGENVIGQIQAAECELVVSFGFMHHVPTLEARRALLELVVEKTVPGGFAIVSFWQFARDERMRAKAVESTDLGVKQLGVCLDEGDYLLGWNGKPGTYRYCHSFSDGEIDELVQSVEHSVVLIDRFRADGRTGELNGYAVFCRR